MLGTVKYFCSQIQCTGEAEYADDIAAVPGEMFAAYVLAKQGNCDILNIDATEALVKQPFLSLTVP